MGELRQQADGRRSGSHRASHHDKGEIASGPASVPVCAVPKGLALWERSETSALVHSTRPARTPAHYRTAARIEAPATPRASGSTETARPLALCALVPPRPHLLSLHRCAQASKPRRGTLPSERSWRTRSTRRGFCNSSTRSCPTSRYPVPTNHPARPGSTSHTSAAGSITTKAASRPTQDRHTRTATDGAGIPAAISAESCRAGSKSHDHCWDLGCILQRVQAPL